MCVLVFFWGGGVVVSVVCVFAFTYICVWTEGEVGVGAGETGGNLSTLSL